MDSDELRRRFKKNLREFKKRKGFTRKELAKKTGLTETTIDNYLAGKGTPYHYNLWILCQVLEVSASDLLGF